MKKPTQNETDIIGLLTKLQEQLAALDKKVEALITKPLPVPKPASQPTAPAPTQGNGRPHDHHPSRPMFQATCADCKKDCEIPFKPSGDRPVYCQECFRRRKSTSTLKPGAADRPLAVPSAQTVITPTGTIQAPPAKVKKRLPAARKPVARRAPSPRKKK